MKKVYATAAEALEGLLHDGMFIAAGGFLSRRVTDPPPPQLVQAADRAGTDETARLSPAAAAGERATPLPNLGVSSETNARVEEAQKGGR